MTKGEFRQTAIAVTSKLTAGQLRLYMTIVELLDIYKNYLEISARDLAAACGFKSTTTVYTHTRELEKNKHIEVERKKSGKHADVNIYRLCGAGAAVTLKEDKRRANGNGTYPKNEHVAEDTCPKSEDDMSKNWTSHVQKLDGKDSLKEEKKRIDKESSSDTGELSLALEGRDLSAEHQDAFASELQGNTPRPDNAVPTDGPTVSAAPGQMVNNLHPKIDSRRDDTPPDYSGNYAVPPSDTLTPVKVSPTAQPDWWGAAWGQLESQYPLLKAECLPFLKLVEADIGAMRFVFEAANQRAYELALRGEASFRRVVADVGGLSFEAVQVEIRETAPAAAGATRFGQIEMRR